MVSKAQQEKGPLLYRLGDKAENLQRLYEAGFGDPKRLQKNGQFGDKNSEGQLYAVEGKGQDMNQEQMEQIANKAATDVVKKLEETRSPASGPAAKELLQAAELLSGALAGQALANQESLKLAAKEAAHEVGAAVRMGAFEKSRLMKAEDAGWNALGIATGLTAGGVAVLALKKALAL